MRQFNIWKKRIISTSPCRCWRLSVCLFSIPVILLPPPTPSNVMLRCITIAVFAACAADASTPPRRLRASAFRLAQGRPTPNERDGGSSGMGPTLEVECEMRKVAFDMAMRHPSAHKHAAMIQTSLGMASCPAHASPSTPTPRRRRHQEHSVAKSLYLDCKHGNDANAGTLEAPFKTAAAAAAAAASISPTATNRAEIIIRSGFCWLSAFLLLLLLPLLLLLLLLPSSLPASLLLLPYKIAEQ